MTQDVIPLNNSAVVIRLERYQNDLHKMKATLNNYICEPRTESLFEHYENLKISLESLSISNSTVLQSIKQQKNNVSDLIKYVNQHFKEYTLLRKEVEKYIVITRGY